MKTDPKTPEYTRPAVRTPRGRASIADVNATCHPHPVNGSWWTRYPRHTSRAEVSPGVVLDFHAAAAIEQSRMMGLTKREVVDAESRSSTWAE